MKTERINVGKNLQRVEREWADGRIHVYFRARFIDWQGIERTPKLSSDKTLARKELENVLAHNRMCALKGEPFDAAKRAAADQQRTEEEAAERAKNRLTIERWLPSCRLLPEMKISSKRGRRRGQPRAEATIANDLAHHGHLARIIGATYLDRLGQKELNRYAEQRAQEFIVRHGEPREGYKVAPGTIRNELSSMSVALRLAKQYGELYREAARDEDDRDAAIKALCKQSGLKEKVLAALGHVAEAAPNPNFSAVKPEAAQRDRILAVDEEKRYFAKARELTPTWFQRVALIANLTALDESSILKLKVGAVNIEAGEIRVLRPKTWEEHHVPLFPEVVAVIEAQLKEQRDRKLRKAVRREDQLVFTRPDDPMAQISLAMVSHWHLTVSRAAKIADFRFQDFRHCAATRWARERSLTAQQWAKAMGWSLSGGGMQQTYINLKQGDVGAAFGLAGVPQT